MALGDVFVVVLVYALVVTFVESPIIADLHGDAKEEVVRKR